MKDKFQLIHNVLHSRNNKLNLTLLCKLANVSRSGYYSWLHNPNRLIREEQDKKDFELILRAYQFKGYDKGVNGIYMRLLHMGVVMNRKKIRRLMRKYNLFCPIRKENPYRRLTKAMSTNYVADNLLNREFEEHGARYAILTDITYLFYGKDRQKAYLSVMKDAYTKEILAYKLSTTLEVDFVLETLMMLIRDHRDELTAETLIHSDQGSHYTSIRYIELLKDKGLRQSMSRRGNCWDNAPQESFFGHMKDELDLTNCITFEQLEEEIDRYMDYYNNDRYQWDLAKLSPKEYYLYITTGKYPITIAPH